MRIVASASVVFAAALVCTAVAGRLAETPMAQPAKHARADTANAGYGTVSLPRQDDGHFWAESSVNGVRVRFLVDTGASAVALTPSDAQRAGFDVNRLSFDREVSTAGGKIAAAYVTLDRVTVGGITLRDVPALVMPGGIDKSLLGMSFLGRLSKMEATPNALILRR